MKEDTDNLGSCMKTLLEVAKGTITDLEMQVPNSTVVLCIMSPDGLYEIIYSGNRIAGLGLTHRASSIIQEDIGKGQSMTHFLEV